jgi:hypothetical protein
MKRYRTSRRESSVDKIMEAVAASGGRVVRGPSPRSAPLEILVEAPGGERLDLVAYAFTANKYRQKGRPNDEHRFQIKYGSEFDRYHRLYIDPTRRRTTLMFGVHEDRGLFVAVDPRMHNPTWFSSSVEFKEPSLDEAERKGWHGWIRERSEARRKRTMPQLDLRTEAVIAFRPEYFMRYVLFERLASGLDCSERLTLSDGVAAEIASGRAMTPEVGVERHRLEELFGLTAQEVLDVIGNAFRLQAAVRGSVAEHHLHKLLAAVPGVSHLAQLDEDGKPDFRLQYRGRALTIECKNVLSRTVGGRVKVDFQRTRHARDNPCARYYARTEFDLLAACVQPITKNWSFRFRATDDLAEHEKCPGRMSQNVYLDEGAWRDGAREALEAMIS